jgi:23S rRNA (pseudouridine1915-N3)-methyltransferase
MKIKIICIGKLKKELIPAADEYIKRLSAFCKLEIIEIAESKLPDIERALDAEALDILKRLSGVSIKLALNGVQSDSESFAEYISDKGEISFIIGSSHGLSDKVKADKALSFGKFTYPHGLMRVILLEQIYRAFMINSHRKYHK